MKGFRKLSIVLLACISQLTFAAVEAKAISRGKAQAQKKQVVIPKVVDINKVDAATLARAVKGFGPKRAAAIIKYRNEKGKFKNVNDLVKVRGIGTKFMERNREYLKKVLRFG